MSRRYGLLFAATLALALLLVAFGHAPARRVVRASSVAAAEDIVLSLTLGRDGVSPEVSRVPKGARVTLRVTNESGRTVSLKLAGNEDRVSVDAIAPGAEWRSVFLADRPGDDFAWLIDGKPIGRLMVTGSHLVEGHR